ncbi:MAG: hypothetical protein J2P28_17070 [Actinobacteria bacterium]|nr:hypothetical protein [Actinomycetota bacterium]
MYAIVRLNTFDEQKLEQAERELAKVAQLHSGQAGYAGSFTVALQEGRHLTVNLWQTEDHARSGRSAIGPEVSRLLEPLTAAPSQLIGAGPVVETDLRDLVASEP